MLYVSLKGNVYKLVDNHALIVQDGLWILKKGTILSLVYWSRQNLDIAIEKGFLQGRVELFRKGMGARYEHE
jgi:hypothetical protein